MSRMIQVFNPSQGGKAYCAPRRAAEYIRKGRAFLRSDGLLEFFLAAQMEANRRMMAEREFEASVRENRDHGMFYWNGVYPQASFPPGCNVSFEHPDAHVR